MKILCSDRYYQLIVDFCKILAKSFPLSSFCYFSVDVFDFSDFTCLQYPGSNVTPRAAIYTLVVHNRVLHVHIFNCSRHSEIDRQSARQTQWWVVEKSVTTLITFLRTDVHRSINASVHENVIKVVTNFEAVLRSGRTSPWVEWKCKEVTCF